MSYPYLQQGLGTGIRNTANEPARPSAAAPPGSHFGTGVRNAISRFSSHVRHGSSQPPRLFFHRGKDGCKASCRRHDCNVVPEWKRQVFSLSPKIAANLGTAKSPRDSQETDFSLSPFGTILCTPNAYSYSGDDECIGIIL